MIKVMRARLPFIGVGILFGLAVNAVTVFAWTGPTASAPLNNIAAPINVGTAMQIKNGDIGVNNFTAFGNISGLAGIRFAGVGITQYLNFAVDTTNAGTVAATTGANGFGIRYDSASNAIQYKSNTSS